MSTKQTSIKRLIILYFVCFAVFLSLLFSAISFLNLYAIEDEYFELQLKEEAEYLNQEFQRTGIYAEPRVPYIQIANSRDEFPEDIRAIALEEPQRVEFDGSAQRYYHVYPLNQEGAYLVAEVSQRLLVRSSRDSIFWLLGVVSTLMIGIAILLAVIVGKKSIQPLSNLTRKVKALSPDDIPKKLPVDYPNNEVGELADAFNQLLQRIHQFIVREQHFTRDISHELRTPLAVIKSSCELILLEKAVLSDKQVEHLQKIVNSSDQMQQVITTLLCLAREDESLLNDKTRVVNVVEKVLLEQINSKNDEVDIQIDIDDSLFLPISEVPLYILLSNLVSNAMHYTEHGYIKIYVTDHTLCIEDSGKGIDAKIKDKATELFIKSPQSQGFGIGLSLVDRLCEQLGLTFQLQHLAQGTRAVIVFKKEV
ncbi:sensor histidine kinase [Pleionea litopenaei]|uniref:histidine kinase n=1 Tax=Pleionea litopenaei TaxID=3070815 RepID=A0AA51RWU1_9GAMM|nr:HAMP domain-containing sensor histidine kinase [Pleionea sp. HL-JVS1]WMS88970.1 HAMP domain-containing sensor histidine kinase [Pleionea sp. HL-JVS1]